MSIRVLKGLLMMIGCARPFRIPAALRMVFGFALLSASLSVHAQQLPPAPSSLPSPLTLPEALNIALLHQPNQYIAKSSVTQALGQRQVAQSEYYPTVTPTYTYENRSQTEYGVANTGTQEITTTGSGTATQTIIPTTRSELDIIRGGGLSATLHENLYDGGEREEINAQARRALDAANYGFFNTRQGTILTVTQDYYTLLQDIDLVKVAQAEVKNYQVTLDLTQAQVKAGTEAAMDTYQAQANLSSAQATLLTDQGNVTSASATLKYAMGVVDDQVVQPALLATGTDLPPLPTSTYTQTLDQALQQADASRPDIAEQKATVQSLDAAVAEAQRQAGVTVSGDYYGTYQATNDIGTRGVTSELLVSGSYPLFDAGSARGTIREDEAQRDSAADTLEQIRQQVHMTVEQAYTTRQVDLQAMQSAQQAVTAAQVSYDATQASFKAGVDTILNVVTAQATLTTAQDQYVVAVYNYYSADAQLQRALGINDQDYLSFTAKK